MKDYIQCFTLWFLTWSTEQFDIYGREVDSDLLQVIFASKHV